MKLFGFTIGGDRKSTVTPSQNIILDQPMDQAATDINAIGGINSFSLDIDGTIRTETDLIVKYRDISNQPEVSYCIDEITNEAIVDDDPDDMVVDIDLDYLELPDNLKEAIRQEFYNILKLLEFDKNSYIIWRKWYIDARIQYYIQINEDDPAEGIIKLVNIDPLRLRFVREVDRNGDNGIDVTSEYYLYNENGWTYNTNVLNTPLYNGGGDSSMKKISKDAIINVTSGLKNTDNSMILSYLHPCLKPINQLRTLEDSSIISRLVRAPQRKAIYVPVGGMPNAKADQYMQSFMNKFRNKIEYNQQTGSIKDDRHHINILEDYFIPTRDGDGAKIETLNGQDNPDGINQIEYFKDLVYRSLKVPQSRVEGDSPFSIGRTGEITRDEVKFRKFIVRLRKQFSQLFYQLLEKQLILKQIMNQEEWDMFEDKIRLRFADDNFYQEMKDAEILRERAATTNQLQPYIGQMFSPEWIMRTVWKADDEKIKEMQMNMPKPESPGQGNEDDESLEDVNEAVISQYHDTKVTDGEKSSKEFEKAYVKAQKGDNILDPHLKDYDIVHQNITGAGKEGTTHYKHHKTGETFSVKREFNGKALSGQTHYIRKI